jgi:TetR/AcrR family transcriptional repressor of nem operon
MKVSRAQSEENRQAVVAEAGRLFREHGFDGIGLSDLMQAAGLTHGGFYKKFTSKDDLARQATANAFAKGRAKWTNLIAKTKGNPLAAFVGRYLSPENRDNVGQGCSFVALAADAARRDDPELSRIFETEARAYLDLLDGISSEEPDDATRDRSVAILSTMVGALLMARVVKDPLLSERFLRAPANAILNMNSMGE